MELLERHGNIPRSPTVTSRSLCSVISGVGEMDIEKDAPKKEEDSQAKERPYPDCPFLLLDVRDRDAYEQCHIIGGEQPQSLRHLGMDVQLWGTFQLDFVP